MGAASHRRFEGSSATSHPAVDPDRQQRDRFYQRRELRRERGGGFEPARDVDSDGDGLARGGGAMINTQPYITENITLKQPRRLPGAQTVADKSKKQSQ